MKIKLPYRSLSKLIGKSAKTYLQNIISNDIELLNTREIIYSLLLTPQGKIVCDLFIFKKNNEFIVDHFNDFATLDIMRRHTKFYKIDIEPLENFNVFFSKDYEVINTLYQDPRRENFGFRIYSESDISNSSNYLEYNIRRIKFLIPEFGVDFEPKKFFPMDLDMEQLNAINFAKGCYLGQEVVAKMYYRGKKKKTLKNFKTGDFYIKDNKVINKEGVEIGVIISKAGDHIMMIARNIE